MFNALFGRATLMPATTNALPLDWNVSYRGDQAIVKLVRTDTQQVLLMDTLVRSAFTAEYRALCEADVRSLYED